MRRNALELEVFAGQEKSELSMIEVARAILELRGRNHEMHFSDLVNEIQNYLGTSNSDIREALPLFYTELNFDGSFISLGDNKWGKQYRLLSYQILLLKVNRYEKYFCRFQCLTSRKTSLLRGSPIYKLRHV